MATKKAPKTENMNEVVNTKPARKPRKAAKSQEAQEVQQTTEQTEVKKPVILAAPAGKFWKVYIFDPESQKELEPWFCATPQKGIRYAFILKSRHSVNIANKAMNLLKEACKSAQVQ